MHYLHASVKARVLRRLADGHDIADVARDEHLDEPALRVLARAAGWPDRHALAKWNSHYSDPPSAPAPAPRPTKRPRRAPRTPSTEAVEVAKLTDQAVAELVADLAVEVTNDAPADDVATEAPDEPEPNPAQGTDLANPVVADRITHLAVDSGRTHDGPTPTDEDTPTADAPAPTEAAQLDEVATDVEDAPANEPTEVDFVRQWPPLAEVTDLIRRAWRLNDDAPRRAVVALFHAHRAVQQAVAAAERDRIAELTAERDRLLASLAAVDGDIATLTAAAAPDPAPPADHVPHPEAPEAPEAHEATREAEATVEHRGIVLVPPIRKGGRWGCGHPGCAKSFASRQGAVVHHSRVHRPAKAAS